MNREETPTEYYLRKILMQLEEINIRENAKLVANAKYTKSCKLIDDVKYKELLEGVKR